MSGFELVGEIPLVARYQRQAVEQIVQCVEDGVYCALLGPRLCGKTVLLRYIERYLSEACGLTCIYIDLLHLRVSTLQGFFAELIHQIAHHLHEVTGEEFSHPDLGQASSSVFRGFLADCVTQLQRDLVLIIEHLEVAPSDLVQALLTSLRAAYMDQQGMDFRAIVVVSGALSLATLTVGESSPFRGIARRVFIGDLSAEASLAMITESLEAEGISTTPQAVQRLLETTRGDAFLIRTICQRCAEFACEHPLARLGAPTVQRVTGRFLRNEVFHYAPLLEAVRLIEEDPDLLHCILLLLEQGTVRKAELPLPLSPDLDPLYLTGVVEAVQDGSYRLQNLIYQRFLAQHFYTGRVGHILAMAGRWDDALDYLESGVLSGDESSRADLLPSTINSMYAAEDPTQAAHFLARGLMAGFGVRQMQVWYAPPQENRLRLIHHVGVDDDHPGQEMPLSADELEARSYRQGTSLRGQEAGQYVRRAIPLVSPGRKPCGVVTLWEELVSGRILEQRKRDLRLAGYLTQAARALLTVSTRRQELALAGRMQASLLRDAPPRLPGWTLAAAWRPARETSGDFYDFIPMPDGKLGLVIADVVDKGMGAALYMALVVTLMRTFIEDLPEHPNQVMRAVNGRIRQDVEAEHFVTVFYGVLDPATGELLYCNAGHNPPYLLRSCRKSAAQPLLRTGMALGVENEGHWESARAHIDPGALLLFYTDGVVDAQNSEEEAFGDRRMIDLVRLHLRRPAHKVQEALLAGLREFVGDEAQFDDMTVMVVKRGR